VVAKPQVAKKGQPPYAALILCNMMSIPRRRSVMANHRGGSGNFAEDRERASEAGKKGGQHSGGNFKNDPQRASEAGKKGGKSSHGKSDN